MARYLILGTLIALVNIVHADILLQPGYGYDQYVQYSTPYQLRASTPEEQYQTEYTSKLHEQQIIPYLQEHQGVDDQSRSYIVGYPFHHYHHVPHLPVAPRIFPPRRRLYAARTGGIGILGPSSFVGSPQVPLLVSYSRRKRSVAEKFDAADETNTTDVVNSDDVAPVTSVNEDSSVADDPPSPKIVYNEGTENKRVNVRQSKNDHILVGNLLGLNPDNMQPGYHVYNPAEQIVNSGFLINPSSLEPASVPTQFHQADQKNSGTFNLDDSTLQALHNILSHETAHSDVETTAGSHLQGAHQIYLDAETRSQKQTSSPLNTGRSQRPEENISERLSQNAPNPSLAEATSAHQGHSISPIQSAKPEEHMAPEGTARHQLEDVILKDPKPNYQTPIFQTVRCPQQINVPVPYEAEWSSSSNSRTPSYQFIVGNFPDPRPWPSPPKFEMNAHNAGHKANDNINAQKLPGMRKNHNQPANERIGSAWKSADLRNFNKQGKLIGARMSSSPANVYYVLPYRTYNNPYASAPLYAMEKNNYYGNDYDKGVASSRPQVYQFIGGQEIEPATNAKYFVPPRGYNYGSTYGVLGSPSYKIASYYNPFMY